MVALPIVYSLLTLALSSAAISSLVIPSPQGCFSRLGSLRNTGSYRYNSISYCTDKCHRWGRDFAAVRGKECACGDSLPALEYVVSDEVCDVPCPGFEKFICGGKRAWSVWALGGDGPSLTSTAEETFTTPNADSETLPASSETDIASSAISAPTDVIERPASTETSLFAGSSLNAHGGLQFQIPLLAGLL
ncbi:hypothetical protein BJX64DRAFT_206420 [Aspergillus heterothallicus]